MGENPHSSGGADRMVDISGVNTLSEMHVSLAARRGAVSSLALAVAVVALTYTPAAAWRKPSRSESRSIKAAAVRSLQGRGWSARAQRVTTVSTRYRYATASVDNSRFGVGGEMILRRVDGVWARVFLGTNDFCGVRIPRAALRDLGFAC